LHIFNSSIGAVVRLILTMASMKALVLIRVFLVAVAYLSILDMVFLVVLRMLAAALRILGGPSIQVGA
jgi:hypothetical protein